MLLVVMCTLLPAVVAAEFVNGGFENDLDGWSSFGNTGVVPFAYIDAVPFFPYAGEKMAAITFPVMSGYIWENALTQDVVLGSDDNYLVFYYNFWTLDEASFDSPGFTVQISGSQVFSVSAGDIGDGVVGTLDHTGWQVFCYDLSEFVSDDPEREITLNLQLNAGNTGDNQYPSGVFLDGIHLQANPIPIPNAALLLLSGLMGLIGIRRRWPGRK